MRYATIATVVALSVSLTNAAFADESVKTRRTKSKKPVAAASAKAQPKSSPSTSAGAPAAAPPASAAPVAAQPSAPPPAPVAAGAAAAPAPVSTTTLTSASAPSAEPSVASSPAPVVAVAPAAATAKDAPSVAEGVVPRAGSGFVLNVGLGAGFLGGSVADGIDLDGRLTTADIRVGAYVNPHLAILVGFRGGLGSPDKGCAGSCSDLYHFQVPLVAQYAFVDRSRGVYLESGFGIASTYIAKSTEKDFTQGAPNERLRATAPLDFKVGIGYRYPFGGEPSTAGHDGHASTQALDVRLGLDVGRFSSFAYSVSGKEIAGDIDSEKTALHTMFGLTAGYSFTP